MGELQTGTALDLGLVDVGLLLPIHTREILGLLVGLCGSQSVRRASIGAELQEQWQQQ